MVCMFFPSNYIAENVTNPRLVICAAFDKLPGAMLIEKRVDDTIKIAEFLLTSNDVVYW